jgi:phosphoenolpyruvate carboxykinase (ATP)
MKLQAELTRLRNAQDNVYINISRQDLIRHVLQFNEAVTARSGALSTWTPPESTGRSPLDTLVVRRAESDGYIDWTSPNNRPLDPETFDMLLEDAIACLKKKTVFISRTGSSARIRHTRCRCAPSRIGH